MNRYANWLIGIVLIFSNLAWSQGPLTVWFQPLTAKEGLTQNYNWYVYHDTEGFVWISSVSGLIRFDGVDLKHYQSASNDSSSIQGENIYSEFFEDHHNDIWFSTPVAIHRYSRKHNNFQRFPLLDSMGQKIAGEYKIQFLERDTFLWVTTGTALYRMNIYRPREPALELAKTVQFKCRMEVNKEGVVCKVYAFGFVGGLEIYPIIREKSGNKPLRADKPEIRFRGEFIREVWPENSTRIWLTSDRRGLVSFNPKSLSRLRVWGEFAGAACEFVHWKAQFLIVAARGKGLFLVDTTTDSSQKITCKFIDQNDAALQSLKDIYIDPDENLWLLDENNGLYFANLHKNKFSSIPKIKPATLNDKYSYWTIKEDLRGNIWVGACQGGVFIFDKNRNLIRHLMQQPDKSNSLPSNCVRDILVDKNNRIYIASASGLVWYDYANDRYHAVRTDSGADVLNISHMCRTASNRILIATETGGIYEIKRGRNSAQVIELYPAEKGRFQTIFEGLDGSLYSVRNSEKICVFQLDNLGLHLRDSLPIGGLVNGFYENSTGKLLYFATSNGIVRIGKSKGSKPVYVTNQNGLPGNYIAGLLADTAANFWLGTNKGLAYFNRNDSLRVFALADGMQSTGFHLQAALKLRNGDLWFGGSNGITIVPAGGLPPDVKTKPKVQLTGIKINDKAPDSIYCTLTGATNVSQIQHLIRPYSENTISFEFVAIEYSDPSNNTLEYKLVGVDDHWVKIEKGKPGIVRYPNLAHGSYTFWLKAVNSDGEPGNRKRVLTIEIKPPWYLQTWFLALATLVALGLIYSIYRFRVNQIRKEADYKRKEAEFRQLEAEAKQQMAETETAILRLQMNPHFIFNSMNSINAYILKNDIDTASDYLGRFASLMRMILNLAAKPFITVGDEIGLLELYLQTEAMRFEKKFSYAFEVDASIDLDETILPTMILQPFVENAIWHGLSNKDGEGRIIIRFEQQQAELSCSVTDNGIGRRAAQALKNSKTAEESKALAISARRLKLLEEETGSYAGFEIIDLKNAGGQALGTQVLIHLPIL